MKKLLFGTVFLAAAMVCPMMATADVAVSIGLPPPIAFSAPPDVVVVPSQGRDVYLVPSTVGLYFYGGHWYRFHNGYWFRASLYSGPWVAIREALVPAPVMIIPPDYVLNMPPGYHRIHYHDFHSHWRGWGRDRYWGHHGWYRDHSAHHWAGTDFRRPPARGHGDIGRRDRGPRGDVGPRDRGPGR